MRKASVDIQDLKIADSLCWYICKCGIVTSDVMIVRSVLSDSVVDDDLPMVLGYGTYEWTANDHIFTLRREQTGDTKSIHNYSLCMLAARYECTTLTATGPDPVTQLKALIQDAVAERNSLSDTDKFVVYRWVAKHNEWTHDALGERRAPDSVVLDATTRRKLWHDLTEFTALDTKTWYHQHCIPYKRGYLLEGPPGTGKTSTVLALTTKLKRHVYRMNVVAPGLCDDSLQSAIQRVPEDAVVLFEDIDSLFGKYREKDEEFSVTFSGLLNCIDGVADYSRGLIFVFTTNHMERINDALIRPGRIDVVLHIGWCTRQQAVEMFLRFYPGEHEYASAFADSVQLADKQSTANVQAHFIMHRTSPAHMATLYKPQRVDTVQCMYT